MKTNLFLIAVVLIIAITSKASQAVLDQYAALIPQARSATALAKNLKAFDFKSLVGPSQLLTQEQCKQIKSNMQSENGYFDNMTGVTIVSDICTISTYTVNKKIRLFQLSGKTNLQLNYASVLVASAPGYIPNLDDVALIFLDSNNQIVEMQDQSFNRDYTGVVFFSQLQIISKDQSRNVLTRSFHYNGSWATDKFSELTKYDFYGFASSDIQRPLFFKHVTYTRQKVSLAPVFEEIAIFDSYDKTWTNAFPIFNPLKIGHVFQYGSENNPRGKAKRWIHFGFKEGKEVCAYGADAQADGKYLRLPADNQVSYDCENYINYKHREQ